MKHYTCVVTQNGVEIASFYKECPNKGAFLRWVRPLIPANTSEYPQVVTIKELDRYV